MSPQNIFYYSVSAAVLIGAAFISYAALNFAKTLRSLKYLIDDAETIAHDARRIREGLLGTVMGILGFIIRKKKI